ncbi:MAG: ADP-ribosylglycohydrolase family protein [Isosphaeraceae bacterium]
MVSRVNMNERLAGTLLGTSLGDALGLPCEGMTARQIARRFGVLDRFHILGRTGYVSDDTEQSALVAQSLARYPDDVDGCIQAFRQSLFGWFCRLPWGVGLATARSCLRIGLGIRPSGVFSAGNGAAMRSAIIGSFFCDQPESRREFARALALVTHRDPRAVEGALFVAEVAAACANMTDVVTREQSIAEARRIVSNTQLGAKLDQARKLADRHADVSEAAEVLGTSGFVVHTVPFACFVFLRFGDDPMRAITEAIRAGGDTDTIGSIVGAWVGTLHGESSLPIELLDQIHDGPFGPSHLRALAACLGNQRSGDPGPAPQYSIVGAMVRNLVLYPVILAHGFRRLVPF